MLRIRRLLATVGLAVWIAMAISAVARGDTLNLELDSTAFSATGAIGFELDALPFLTGGYHGSLWFGPAPWRLRAAVAEVSVPEFATQPQWARLHLDVVALIVDWFFGAGAASLTGPWVGGGIERWNASVEAKDARDSTSFSNDVATVGGGYVLRLRGNWYLNPWFALHQVVGGDTSVTVGKHVYHPNPTSGEVSLKLGWHF